MLTKGCISRIRPTDVGNRFSAPSFFFLPLFFFYPSTLVTTMRRGTIRGERGRLGTLCGPTTTTTQEADESGAAASGRPF